ncbi:MAG: methyltransferase domain-containing protein [Candidatus Marinimicrobia bacterium]|nr:methyltransferase domain-containing protein [Candidatus Neomarinimicrobiota bacterium]
MSTRKFVSLIYPMPEKDFYQRIAPIYDTLLTPLIKNLRKEVVRWICETKPHRVLDLCCGTGHQLSLIPDEILAFGVDLSPAMLHKAQETIPGKCILADVTKTPFADNSFDLILSQFALHEKPMEIIESELQEAQRLLKPNGQFAIIDFAQSTKKGLLPWVFAKGISWIESHTDDTHSSSFKDWMKYGALDSIMESNGWINIRRKEYYKGTLVFGVYRYS